MNDLILKSANVGTLEANNSTLTNATITTLTGGSPTGLLGASLTSKTQLANGASQALAKNVHYLMPADGNACTLTLPTQANSTLGDVIVLEWQVDTSNGQTQKVGTAGEFFMAKSAIYKCSGATGSAVTYINTVDVADGSGDDFANFIGLTNSGPGVGSFAVCTFNGSVWRMEARCTPSGTGAAANLSVFAAT